MVHLAWMFLFFLGSLHSVEGTATFQLQLVNFTNPSDREADGDCCESIVSFLGCGTTCDPYFKICLDISAGSSSDASSCAFMSTKSQIYHDTVTIVFGNSISGAQLNPILHNFQRWPGSVLIKIQVYDDDDANSDDYMGLMYETFSQSRASRDRDTAATDSTVPIHFSNVFATHTISLNAKASVYCDQDYYGGVCDVFCQPHDDDVNGHYTCDSATGMKLCRQDYYGSECKVLCQGQDSDLGHYQCNQQGTIECLPGWTNETSLCLTDIDECANGTITPCSPYGNCSNVNGSYTCQCDDNHTGVNCTELIQHCSRDPCHVNNTVQCNDTEIGFVCTCAANWTAIRCDVPVTPCTSRPCLNGATCSIQGDNYQCTCRGRWTGDQCETLQTFTTSDFITIYVKGQLSDTNRPAFIEGVTEMLLNLKNVTLETLVLTAVYLDGSQNLTQINITIYSKTHDVTGLLSDLFSEFDESVTNTYIPNPIYKGQIGDREVRPMTVSEPWVKKYWYIVLIIILVLLGIIVILVTVLHFLKKRRDAKMKNGLSVHSSVHSNGTVSDSLPDAAIGFDNSLYFEVNHDKVSGLPNGASH